MKSSSTSLDFPFRKSFIFEAFLFCMHSLIILKLLDTFSLLLAKPGERECSFMNEDHKTL